MRRLLHLTFLCLLLSGATMAQNRYWRPASAADLRWNVAANWSSTTPAFTATTVPSVGNTVIFDATNTLGCNLNVASIVVAGLQINTGYTGTVTQLTSNFALTVLGDVSMNSGSFNMRADGLGSFTNLANFTQTGGTFNAVGSLEFDGNFTFDAPAVFNAGTSTVTFNGDNNGFANRTININAAAAGSLTLYNVILDKANPGTQNLNIAANDNLIVQNDLTLSNGSLGTGAGIVQVGRNLTVEPGFLGAATDLILNGAGNSIVTLDAPWKLAGNGNITINKTNPASTVDFVTSLPSNTIDLSTGATNGTFAVTSGTVRFPDNDASNINFGTFNISAAGTFSAPNNNLTIPSNITVDGTFIPNTGTVLLSSTAVRTIDINGALTSGTLNFYNLTLNNSSANGNVNVENTDIINVANNLSITDGRFNTTGGGTATVQVGGNLSTTTAAADASNALVTLSFTGSNAQSVSLFAGTQGNFNGPVVINKTGGDVTLLSSFILDQANQTLALTSGVINTTAANYLHLIGNNVTYTGGSAASYVNGFIRRTGSTAFTFPTGNAGFYAPIHISNSANFTGAGTTLPNNPTTGNLPTYQAQYIRSNPQVPFPNNAPQPTDGNTPATVLTLSQQEYYVFDFVSDIPGFPPTDYASANMPFLFMSYENLRSGGIAQPTSVAVIAWLTNRWENLSNGGLTNVGGIDYLRSNVRAFSAADNNPVFSFGTNNPILNPLPVEWLDFTGRKAGSTVELSWTTSSEKNNESFTVERSGNGTTFTAIGTVAGNGTTNLTSYYTFTDKAPLAGISVYRIKQTDDNGKYSYSPQIRISASGVALAGLRLYPNPVNASIPTYLENSSWRNQKVELSIISAIGTVVRKEQISFGGDSRAKINVSGLQKGTYFISTQVNGEKNVVPFVIQ